ncbi:MAG: hypothetical protein RL552_506 [Actinomycetota bacterium]
MTRIGLRGAPCGEVDAWGVARLDDHREPVSWWVAASDKWHDPRHSPSVRQRAVDGTPVVETKLAVPGGDVVHRAYVVADQGGALVYEFENRSPSAVVVAVPTRDLATTASSAGGAPHGLDLPHHVRAFPLTHSSTVTFAWPLRRPRRRFIRTQAAVSIDAGTLASHDAVVRGWAQACEKASRVSVAPHELTASRCQILLATVQDLDDTLRADAAVGVLAVVERTRMGDPPGPWITAVADAVQRIARRPQASAWSWRALSAAATFFSHADEVDAANDTTAAWQKSLDEHGGGVVLPPVSDASELARAVTHSATVEDRLARPVSPLETQLFSDGLAGSRGVNFEAHAVHAGPRHRLSLAVRWHGENAALLWEVDGPPGLRLTAPAVDAGFSTLAAQGEALLKVTA